VRALLDTHAFLWFVTGNRALGPAADRLIEHETSELMLSIASVWEIAIKAGLRRLELMVPVEKFVSEQLRLNRIVLLPIALDHAVRVASLPHYHRDPFDRMLVSQAQMEEMPIISADAELDPYGITRVW
jgi:PIN domain nuclease of toxin-antitoxin system